MNNQGQDAGRGSQQATAASVSWSEDESEEAAKGGNVLQGSHQKSFSTLSLSESSAKREGGMSARPTKSLTV